LLRALFNFHCVNHLQVWASVLQVCCMIIKLSFFVGSNTYGIIQSHTTRRDGVGERVDDVYPLADVLRGVPIKLTRQLSHETTPINPQLARAQQRYPPSTSANNTPEPLLRARARYGLDKPLTQPHLFSLHQSPTFPSISVLLPWNASHTEELDNA